MNNIITKENQALGEKYYYIKHKSGLDIYVFPKKLTSSYALFGTRYGSIDNKFRLVGEADYTEVPDGIAHFLEHKMFENANGEDTFERYAKTGASANAYTSFDRTAYLFSCTERFYESLAILLEMVTEPYFTPKTIEKEQGIIGQEIRMYEDNPGVALEMGMLSSLYARHNIRRDIAGTIESISKITSDILYKCYNTFYNLRNMALCVCGDVTVDETLKVADRILKAAPVQEVDSVRDAEEPQVASEFFTKKMQVAKPLFCIGVKDIDISSDPVVRQRKSAGLAVLLDMLFGKSEPFFNGLYEKGLISEAFDYGFEHNRSFSFITLSGESEDPAAVYEQFKGFISGVAKTGLSRERFELYKKVNYADEIKGYDSTEEIANDFLSFVFDDADMLEYPNVIASLDFEYVSELFYKTFSPERYCLAQITRLDG